MRCAPGYQGLSRDCPRNGKRVRARHNATGLSWEGGASSLVSPETGLRRHAEVLRGCGAGAGIGGLLIPPWVLPFFCLSQPVCSTRVGNLAGPMVRVERSVSGTPLPDS